MSDYKSVAKKGVTITIVLVASKIMGFLRELIIAASYGATRETDIFKMSTNIPTTLFSAVSAALVTTFIPVFSNVKNDKDKANKFFSNVHNIIFILCSIITVFGIAFAPFIVKLFVSGFDNESFQKTVFYTRIALPSIIFLGLSGLYTGYLQSYGIFLQPAMTDFAANIVIIVGILIFSSFGITAAVISVLVGAIAQILVQRPFMKGYKYSFNINFRDSNIKLMVTLGLPVFISNIVNQLNSIVNSNFASQLDHGDISIIEFATKISTIINQVFIVSVVTVLYPMLTEKFLKKDKSEFKEMTIKLINIVLILGIPLIIGMIILRKPIIRVLLQHGKFDDKAAAKTAIILAILAIGTLGYALLDTVSKVFFAARETKIPMINGFILVAINIIFIFILKPILGLYGLPLSTTLSALIMGAVILIELKYKMKGISLRKVSQVLIKCFVAGIIMGGGVKLTYGLINLLNRDNFFILVVINLIVSTLVGLIIYVPTLKLFKVEEVNLILNFRKKNGRFSKG